MRLRYRMIALPINEQRPGGQAGALQKSIPAGKPVSTEVTGAVRHIEV